MKVDLRRFKIEKAAAGARAFRPPIEHPYLDADEKVLVATDAFVLAVIPVEVDDSDVSGPVPTAAITEARRRTKRPRKGQEPVSEIKLNGRAEVGDGEVSFKRPAGVVFPTWPKLVEAPEGEKPIAVFGINPAKLLQVAEAMGCGRNDHVQVAVYDPQKSIHVSARDGARGVIMPVRLVGWGS